MRTYCSGISAIYGEFLPPVNRAELGQGIRHYACVFKIVLNLLPDLLHPLFGEYYLAPLCTIYGTPLNLVVCLLNQSLFKATFSLQAREVQPYNRSVFR